MGAIHVAREPWPPKFGGGLATITIVIICSIVVFVFSGFRWNNNYQQSRFKRFLHLSKAGWDVRASTWLYIHALGLQSVDWLCTKRWLSDILSTAVPHCNHCDFYFPVLEQRPQSCDAWGHCAYRGSHDTPKFWCFGPNNNDNNNNMHIYSAMWGGSFNCLI